MASSAGRNRNPVSGGRHLAENAEPCGWRRHLAAEIRTFWTAARGTTMPHPRSNARRNCGLLAAHFMAELSTPLFFSDSQPAYCKYFSIISAWKCLLLNNGQSETWTWWTCVDGNGDFLVSLSVGHYLRWQAGWHEDADCEWLFYAVAVHCVWSHFCKDCVPSQTLFGTLTETWTGKPQRPPIIITHRCPLLHWPASGRWLMVAANREACRMRDQASVADTQSSSTATPRTRQPCTWHEKAQVRCLYGCFIPTSKSTLKLIQFSQSVLTDTCRSYTVLRINFLGKKRLYL